MRATKTILRPVIALADQCRLPTYYTYLAYAPTGLWVPGLKFFYIPIPKVASGSIKKSLSKWMGMGDDYQLHQDILRDSNGKVLYQRVPLSAACDLDFDKSYAVVRNPLSRLYSCYRNKVSFREDKTVFIFRRYGTRFSPNMSFDEFARMVCSIPDKYSEEHFRSQYNWIYTTRYKVPSLIGNMEELNETWSHISDYYGFETLGERHKTDASDSWKISYTYELARLVSHRYAMDIDLFGYRDEIEEFLRSLK